MMKKGRKGEKTRPGPSHTHEMKTTNFSSKGFCLQATEKESTKDRVCGTCDRA